MLGPFARVLADRIGGRQTLLLTQVVAAAIAAGLAAAEFCHVLTEWPLVGGALLGGLTFTFALPARNVTVRRLVPAEDTRPAFVMDAVSYNLGRALAPPLTVLIVVTLHWYGLPFAANAVTFLVFTLLLVLAGKGADAEPERRSRVKDGFLIARRNHRVMLLLLMVAAVTIADYRAGARACVWPTIWVCRKAGRAGSSRRSARAAWSGRCADQSICRGSDWRRRPSRLSACAWLPSSRRRGSG